MLAPVPLGLVLALLLVALGAVASFLAFWHQSIEHGAGRRPGILWRRYARGSLRTLDRIRLVKKGVSQGLCRMVAWLDVVIGAYRAFLSRSA